MSLYFSASASPLYRKICLIWRILIWAFIFAVQQISAFVIWHPTWCFLIGYFNIFCPWSKNVTDTSDNLLTSIVHTRFSNTVYHHPWFYLHVCVWELSWSKIMQCYLWAINDAGICSCLITKETDEHGFCSHKSSGCYITTEPYSLGY